MTYVPTNAVVTIELLLGEPSALDSYVDKNIITKITSCDSLSYKVM